KEVIELREKGGDYASVVRARHGKELMDDLRASFAELVRVEEGLRDERSEAARRAARASIVVVGGLLLLGTSLLVFFYRLQLASISRTYERAFEDRAALLLREKAAREEAEAAVRVRDVFLSVASHELRTPLMPLTLQLQGVARMIEKEPAAVDPRKVLDKVV